MNIFLKTAMFFFSAVFISSTLFAQDIPIRIACIGNSITEGVGATSTTCYPPQLASMLGSHYEVKNFGVSGRTLLKKGDYPYWNESAFVNAQKYKPQIIVIELGTNDSKPQNWKYKDEFYGDYVDMVRVFKKACPHAAILVGRPTPVYNDWPQSITGSIVRDEIIPLIDSVSKTENVILLDNYTPFLNHAELFSDGIHPNATGYTLMAANVKKTILSTPTGYIRYFTSSSYSFQKGETAKLYWETSKGTNPTINGVVVNDADSMLVPTTSKDNVFSLITNGIHKDTINLTVHYYAPGNIVSFTGNHYELAQTGGDTCTLKWSVARGTSAVKLNGNAVNLSDSVKVSPKTTTTYYLTAEGDVKDTSIIVVKLVDTKTINRALGCSVLVSSTQGAFTPDLSNDGDTSTYWQSGIATTQWCYLDFLRPLQFNRVVLKWGSVFATQYNIQSITDSYASTTIYSATNGKGGIESISNLNGTGRYLRLVCTARNDASTGYMLKEIEVYGQPNLTDVKSDSKLLGSFTLNQNYPNPFNPSTVISYSIPSEGFVTLKVYNILGQCVSNLVEGNQKAGSYLINFNASNLSSGCYFYTLSCKDMLLTRKLLLLK